MHTRRRPVRRMVTLSGTGTATSAAPGRRRVTRTLVPAVPVVVPLTMRLLFPALARRLGTRRGYLAGFGLYWAGCYLLTIGLLGRHQVQALVRHPARPLPSPRWLPTAALLVPPLGAASTELLPQLRTADPAVLAAAATIASVNAAAEELLWHGLFVATFPDDPLRAGCGQPSASPPGTWPPCRCGPTATAPWPSWPLLGSSGPGTGGWPGGPGRCA